MKFVSESIVDIMEKEENVGCQQLFSFSIIVFFLSYHDKILSLEPSVMFILSSANVCNLD